MTPIVEAIERFEAALAASKTETPADRAVSVRCYDPKAQAEAALIRLLLLADTGDHDAVCEHAVVGCTEAFEHDGTIYAPGFDSDGDLILILIRRVTPAGRVDRVKAADWRSAS